MSGSGTSFNQPYTQSFSGGILSAPYGGDIGGYTSSYEEGGGAISTNYAPTLNLTKGGRKRRGRKTGRKPRRKSGKKSRKECSLCKMKLKWF